jgi:hypothetical protein
MRTSRSPFVLPFACLLAIGVHVLPAQEPTPGGAAPAEASPARPTRPGGQDPRQGPGGRQRSRTTVIEAGTVHPATGPAIQNGVVVIRGGRIAAVGKKGEVEVPPNAVTVSYPDGHIYPGLIDAATDAYTDDALRGEGGLDAGLDLSLDLRPRNPRDDALASHGITTAYVTVRSPAQFRGQGAIVRPRANGFEAWPEKVRTGLQTRITNGPGATHALQRLAQFEAMQKQFDGLEDYRKAKKDYTEALLKYEKEFQEYLDYHQKKSGGAGGEAKAAEGGAPAAERSARPEGAPRPTMREGRRGPPPGGGVAETPAGEAKASQASQPESTQPESTQAGQTQSPEALEAALLTLLEAVVQDPQPRPQGQPGQGPQGQAPQGGNGAPAQGAPAKDEGPKRPTYPKKPGEDPTKEALLKVLDGELALRIEAHRPDEVRAALDLQKKHAIPLLVVEQAYGAAGEAKAIAQQGAMVVLTEVLPGRMTKQYEAFDVMRLPAALQAAGAPFAIATGSARRAATLPLMAATAVAGGLDEAAALRAITLTPAEILGIAKDTGSLTEGKFADVIVTDRPLFASDSRVLLVLSQGRIEFEAK